MVVRDFASKLGAVCDSKPQGSAIVQERDTLMNGQFMVLSNPVRLWGNR